MDVRIDSPHIGVDHDVCEAILRALPTWFGIEEAIVEYVQFVKQNPTVMTFIDDKPMGFLSIKHHSPYTSEIYVMGILPEYHRLGIGRSMVLATETALRDSGVEFLQVKTLASSHPDPGYALTRRFYKALKFRELEEFPTLWGESNPCLMLIKSL